MFVLDVDDGWPPVAKECMPVTSCSDGFRLEVSPLFIKNMSRGDVISVTRNEYEEVTSWKIVSPSSHSTVWIMAHGDKSIDDALERLKALRCNIVNFEEYRYYSVDVPPECSVDQLDSCFVDLGEDEASVAFPSFRHG